MKSVCLWTLILLCLLQFLVSTDARTALGEEALETWKAPDNAAAELGELFSDSQIIIRPPRGLQKANGPKVPQELEKHGVHGFGWTPDGAFPSSTNLSVSLTPFAKPSSDALDKTIKGMKNSISSALQEVKFGTVESGMFRNHEARWGTYTATINDEKILAFFLVGIDPYGTYSISAMIPATAGTPENVAIIKNSMLTFDRSERK
jgi:hypothetical protein